MNMAKANAVEVEAPEGEKKERAQRQDYGFLPGATITIVAKENTYRGKRLEYYNLLVKADGKTIEKFFDSCPVGDPPRGWLRFFVQDGAATLAGGSKPEAKPKAEKEEKPAKEAPAPASKVARKK
jgi:hypothetical protein